MSTPDPDVHGLTAGYAVNALTPAERARAAEHVEECADCRRDLADFQATLVQLAYGASRTPEEEVWTRIRAAAQETRQLPPRTTAPPRAASSDRRRALPWFLAAASVLVALVLGGVLAATHQGVERLREHSAEVEALLAAPDTSMREAPVPGTGARARVFSSYEKDAVMVVVDGLPSAPPGMAYQMWYVDDDGMRSAGMLESSDDGMYSGMAEDMGAARQLGITVEPESGGPEPSGEPMKIDL